jgi:hypothetical protein
MRRRRVLSEGELSISRASFLVVAQEEPDVVGKCQIPAIRI